MHDDYLVEPLLRNAGSLHCQEVAKYFHTSALWIAQKVISGNQSIDQSLTFAKIAQIY